MTTSASTVAARQLEFEFMREMPLQLNPTGFAALKKSVGGDRHTVTRSSS